MVIGTLMGTIAAILFLGIMFLTQIIQIAKNETSIEGMLESDRLKAHFDKGTVAANFKDYFGSSTPWYRILFPLI